MRWTPAAPTPEPSGCHQPQGPEERDGRVRDVRDAAERRRVPAAGLHLSHRGAGADRQRAPGGHVAGGARPRAAEFPLGPRHIDPPGSAPGGRRRMAPGAPGAPARGSDDAGRAADRGRTAGGASGGSRGGRRTRAARPNVERDAGPPGGRLRPGAPLLRGRVARAADAAHGPEGRDRGRPAQCARAGGVPARPGERAGRSRSAWRGWWTTCSCCPARTPAPCAWDGAGRAGSPGRGGRKGGGGAGPGRVRCASRPWSR